LKLVCRDDGGRYSLCGLAREYLLRESPYYIGDALYLDLQKSLPDAYLKMPTGVCASGGAEPDWPIGQRLRIQHSRNFAPSVIAARSGAFSAIRHLVDIAGGTGVLAIPLAMDRPDIRITLVDMPETLPYIRETLAGYGVEDRIKLVGLDVFKDRWDVGPCDGVHFGNFFHFVSDEQCRFLARKTFEILPRGGLVWLHEVLLNENRDGPILAVLWNANMIIRRPGARQRTASELIGFLRDVGFSNFGVKPTAGSFSLLSGVKV
jgi:acetylserotonin N-methyltransferase